MNSIWLVGALLLWFVVLPAGDEGPLALRRAAGPAPLLVRPPHRDRAHPDRPHAGVGGDRGRRRATDARSPATIARIVKVYDAAHPGPLWAGLVRGTWIRPRQLLGHGRPRRARRPTSSCRCCSCAPPAPARGAAVPRRGRSTVPPAMAASASRSSDRASGGRRRPSRGSTPAPGPRRFRPDIQGLRAVAVLLVVLYHAHVPGVTRRLRRRRRLLRHLGLPHHRPAAARDRARTGRISLVAFYGGRIRRLLPPAVIVVARDRGRGPAVGLDLPRRSVAIDALFTLFYGINYRLAALGVDYQNANGPESPLQHMWSLAVEEQFYVIWPLLIARCARCVGGRHRRRPLIATMLVRRHGGLAVRLGHADRRPTRRSPTSASTPAPGSSRSGALVAMAAGAAGRMPRRSRCCCRGPGLVAMVASAFVYTDDTAFPGTAALLPTLGAAAVIAGRLSAHRGRRRVAAAARPLQGIGRVSYGWYLWHWPMVVLVPLAVRPRARPGSTCSRSRALALWFAVLTHYLVETPVAAQPAARRQPGSAAACCAPVRWPRWPCVVRRHAAGLRRDRCGRARRSRSTAPTQPPVQRRPGRRACG